MINCQNIIFSEKLSSDRISVANNFFGEKVVKKILAFSLFVLGVKRTQISEILNMPLDTIKSSIKTLYSDGINAFEDRRQSKSSFLPVDKKSDISIATVIDNEILKLVIAPNINIQIPLKNKLQLRTFILTMLNNEIIKPKQAAQILNLSTVQTNNLAQQIKVEDIHCLLDKRTGQKKNYKITPEISAEIIQQYALDCISKQRTSGRIISNELEQRCNLKLSERTIRYHINNLGLLNIKKSLPKLYKDLKKNC